MRRSGSPRWQLGAAAALVALSIGCGAARSPVGHTRFHNRDPVWVVDDRRHVAEQPEELDYLGWFYHYDGHIYRRLDRWLASRPERRAANVNSLGEVPDSTWFTNRIGVRTMTPEEVATGPNRGGSPEDHKPWKVKSSKASGVSVGFIIEDQRGETYLLKFDKPELPEVETGAAAVAQRLMWAAGYNVPEDQVVELRREDLVIAEDAVVAGPRGGERPMPPDFIDEELSRVTRGADGRMRALASKFIPGEPLGGHPREGVRPDDPNDTVPHEQRRELRGLRAIFAWLSLTDIKQDNFLDTWVEDPADPNVKYVVHYVLDFDSALGAQGADRGRIFVGHSYELDFRDMGLSLITAGMYRRPFEGRGRLIPQLRGVGMFEAESYDPGRWKAYSPSYFPLLDADRFDAFWGAKIIARFTPAQIRAAVEQGRYSDPRAVDYLTRVLIQRQRKTARYWFRRVAPLDRFAVEPGSGGARLCFEDLAVRYRLEPRAAAATRYDLSAFDEDGAATGWQDSVQATRSGRACAAGLRPGPGRDGYTIVRVETRRPGLELPATLVHLARHPRTGALRVIGLRRL